MKVKKSRDFAETNLFDILDSTDKTLLSSFLSSFQASIKDKYNLDGKEIRVLVEDKEENIKYIPVSIFTRKIGILETAVKFLRENQELSFKEISNILKKTQNNVAVSYQNAKRKQSAPFSNIDYSEKLPLSIFSNNRTCLESIVLFLKASYNYHEIGKLLDRDERTIWTVYQRAAKKGGYK
ncbi:MAG: hypothetical protein ABIJ34_03115 [archaeon]